MIDEFASMPGVGLETSRAVIHSTLIGSGSFADVKHGTYRLSEEQTPTDVAVKIFRGGRMPQDESASSTNAAAELALLKRKCKKSRRKSEIGN